MNLRIASSGALFLGALLAMRHYKKPRGIRNNNPLNIRKSRDNWQGKIGDDGEFLQFETPEKGIRAAAKILKTYRDKYGLFTVDGIVSRWAPPNENNTQSYINSVASRVGVASTDNLSDSDYEKLIAAMIHHENGVQPYSGDVINDGFKQGFYDA